MKRMDNERGAVTVLVALGMVAMLGVTALVTDYGRLVLEDHRLTRALDAAVLAGVQELPDHPDAALEIAEDYLILNGFRENDGTFSISADGRGIQGTGTVTRQNYFARVLGQDTSTVSHTSGARIDGVSRLKSGARPFGVVFERDDAGELLPPDSGDAIVLKVGSQTIEGEEVAQAVLGPGNFGALDLDGHQGGGNSAFVDDAVNGSDEEIAIGDWIYTETGNMPGVIKELKKYFKGDGVTFEQAQAGVPTKRIWIIPVVSTMDVTGTSEAVEVLGFAVYYIDDIIGKNDAQSALIGRFLDLYRVEGTSDPAAPKTGLFAIALTR